MRFFKKIRSLLCNTCVIFSITVLLVLGVWAAISSQKVASTALLFSQAASVFAFSFLLCCINEIFRVRKLNILLRVLIHFAGFMLIFYFIFIRFSNYFESNSGAFLIMLLVGIIYIIIAAIILAIRHLITRKKQNDEKYESQFNFEN